MSLAGESGCSRCLTEPQQLKRNTECNRSNVMAPNAKTDDAKVRLRLMTWRKLCGGGES